VSELKTAVEVAQALERGEVVECHYIGARDIWAKVNPSNWLWKPDWYTYRIKPKPLEFWVNAHPDNTVSVFHTKESAKKFDNGNLSRVAVHMREVTND